MGIRMILALLVFVSFPALAAPPPLIPLPTTVAWRDGAVPITDQT